MKRRSRLRSSRSIGALLVIRLLLIANGLVLASVGGLYLRYGSRPDGLVAGGVLIAGAVGLFACVRFTNPYRRRRG